MSNADEKEAVGFAINLSSQVINAALAMLAIQFAYVAFALGNRTVGPVFYVTSSISFISYIVSIFWAGRGIAVSYSRGAKGNWDITHGDSLFNFQAIFCLLGLLSFFISIFFSYLPANSVVQKKVVSIDSHINEVNRNISILNKNATQFNESFLKQNKDISKISLEIVNLQKAVLELKCEPPKKEKTTGQTP